MIPTTTAYAAIVLAFLLGVFVGDLIGIITTTHPYK